MHDDDADARPFSSRLRHQDDDPGFLDSDDDTIAADEARTSTELAQYDRETLEEEEDGEKLIIAESNARHTAFVRRVRDGERPRRIRRKKANTWTTGEEAKELMYEMEEGGPRLSRTPSSGNSSELDRDNTGRTHGQTKVRRSDSPCHILLTSQSRARNVSFGLPPSFPSLPVFSSPYFLVRIEHLARTKLWSIRTAR